MGDWHHWSLGWIGPNLRCLACGTSSAVVGNELAHSIPEVLPFDEVLCLLNSRVCHVSWFMIHLDNISTEIVIGWYIDFVPV